MRHAGLGLKASIESIDNRGDFRTYLQNYAYARGGVSRGPRREGPIEEGFVSSRIARVDQNLRIYCHHSFPQYRDTTSINMQAHQTG